jgi:dipeptidyl-peptidase-4
MFNRQNKTMARLDGTKLFLLASLMLVPTIVKSTPPVGAELFKSVVETHGFENGLPILPCFTPDGKTVLFLRSGPRDMVLRLFQMDVQSGVTSELISPEALLKGAAESLSPEEKARRERQRESHQPDPDQAFGLAGSVAS